MENGDLLHEVNGVRSRISPPGLDLLGRRLSLPLEETVESVWMKFGDQFVSPLHLSLSLRHRLQSLQELLLLLLLTFSYSGKLFSSPEKIFFYIFLDNHSTVLWVYSIRLKRPQKRFSTLSPLFSPDLNEPLAMTI